VTIASLDMDGPRSREALLGRGGAEIWIVGVCGRTKAVRGEEMLIALPVDSAEDTELGGLGKRGSDGGVRALVLIRKGSVRIRSTMGLCRASRLCRPSSRAGLAGGRSVWNGTLACGVFGVGGI
jgi:hypothetical protein